MRRFPTLVFVLFLVAGSLPALAQQPPVQESGRKRLVANELEGPLLEVHFLDVGQGDSMYVRTPNMKNYLIDVGTRSARKQIIPYLKYLDVKKLDGILISHSHDDHAGALFHILEAIPVDAVYSSGYFHNSGRNRKALKLMEEKKVVMKKLRAGDTFELDKGVKVAVYHPPTAWDGEVEGPNDMSVVLRLSYGEIDFMLTGDAEKRSEKEILKQKYVLKSEFLKVGHHGSDTSTSNEFLAAVEPLYAVISCGVDNKFNHPHADTMKRLKAHDVTILRTDHSGTFGVYTNGKRIMIKIKGKDWQPVSMFIRHPQPGRYGLVVQTRGGVYA